MKFIMKMPAELFITINKKAFLGVKKPQQAEEKLKKEKLDKFKESLKEGGLKFLEGAKIFSKD